MQTHPEPLALGAEAPPFDLPTTDGGRIALADLGAEVVVYVQGCNHCPMVLAYVDRLKALARDLAPRGVAFVMVNSNDADAYPSDGFDEMQRFAREHDLPFPYAWDRDQSVARAYRTFRTPEPLVFDRERHLRYRGRIDDGGKDATAVTRHDLRDAIEAVLEGREVTDPESWAVGCTVKWKPGNEPVVPGAAAG